MVELKSYPAQNGDAFLVKATDTQFAMLIDGGYANTFQRYVRPDLAELAAAGYELNVVVSTHIDADHISGLLSFLRLNGRDEAPTIIPVREVLHNSLRSLVTSRMGAPTLRTDDVALLRAIRQRGYPPPSSSAMMNEEISARQGSSLADILRNGGYRWNSHDGTLLVSRDGLADLRTHGAHVTVLGPSRLRLDALQNWWISEIRRLGLVGSWEELDDVFEFLCVHEVFDPAVQTLTSCDGDLRQLHVPDDSITNGSSISLLVEVEGSRLLFLGDAWPEDIVAALQQNGPAVFDAIKVAHHGSTRNTSPELLTLIDSPHFWRSKHSHPATGRNGSKCSHRRFHH